MITDIIGKRFRRNKYGLSTWEDTIKDIHYVLEVNAKPEDTELDEKGKLLDMFTRIKKRRQVGKKLGYKVVPKIIGNNTLTSYDLDEIIIFL